MRIVGVLDVKDGVVVRGVGGRRENYRPIESPLCPSPEPLAVALALRRAFDLDELYLADLDAIAGAGPALAVYHALRRAGFHLWVDAGLRNTADGQALADEGVETVVAGLEKLAGPEVLGELVRSLGQRLVFSLDLRGGVPLKSWAAGGARGIAREAVAMGVRRLLVLDLARVGEGGGTGTEELCADLAAACPGIELAAGGGVRNRDDLLRLRRAGVAVVLAASALHDGRLTREDLAGL